MSAAQDLRHTRNSPTLARVHVSHGTNKGASSGKGAWQKTSCDLLPVTREYRSGKQQKLSCRQICDASGEEKPKPSELKSSNVVGSTGKARCNRKKVPALIRHTWGAHGSSETRDSQEQPCFMVFSGPGGPLLAVRWPCSMLSNGWESLAGPLNSSGLNSTAVHLAFTWERTLT